MDIEKYIQNDPAEMDPLTTLLLVMAKMRQEAQEGKAEIARIDERLDRVEMVAAESTEWMTVAGFIGRYEVNVEDTSLKTVRAVGARLTNWHGQTNRHMRKGDGFHPVFGKVNLYKVSNMGRRLTRIKSRSVTG